MSITPFFPLEPVYLPPRRHERARRDGKYALPHSSTLPRLDPPRMIIKTFVFRIATRRFVSDSILIIPKFMTTPLLYTSIRFDFFSRAGARSFSSTRWLIRRSSLLSSSSSSFLSSTLKDSHNHIAFLPVSLHQLALHPLPTIPRLFPTSLLSSTSGRPSLGWVLE